MNLVWRGQRQECLLARWNLLPLGLEQGETGITAGAGRSRSPGGAFAPPARLHCTVAT